MFTHLKIWGYRKKKEATFSQMHDENAVVDDVTLAGVTCTRMLARASNTGAGGPTQKDEFLPSRDAGASGFIRETL